MFTSLVCKFETIVAYMRQVQVLELFWVYNNANAYSSPSLGIQAEMLTSQSQSFDCITFISLKCFIGFSPVVFDWNTDHRMGAPMQVCLITWIREMVGDQRQRSTDMLSVAHIEVCKLGVHVFSNYRHMFNAFKMDFQEICDIIHC